MIREGLVVKALNISYCPGCGIFFFYLGCSTCKLMVITKYVCQDLCLLCLVWSCGLIVTYNFVEDFFTISIFGSQWV